MNESCFSRRDEHHRLDLHVSDYVRSNMVQYVLNITGVWDTLKGTMVLTLWVMRQGSLLVAFAQVNNKNLLILLKESILWIV